MIATGAEPVKPARITTTRRCRRRSGAPLQAAAH